MAKVSKPNVANPDKKAAPALGLPGKTVEASKSEMVEAVLPNDANSLGAMLGGRVMHFIDISGELAAPRSFEYAAQTAAVLRVDASAARARDDLSRWLVSMTHRGDTVQDFI